MTADRAILVDIGTSRIKATSIRLDSGTVLARADGPSPTPDRRDSGEVASDPLLHRKAFLDILASLPAGEPPTGIWLCAEMHGFLLDDGKGRPLTQYVSWRDERASRDGSPSTLNRFQEDLGKAYQEITGMAVRPGLPALVLAHLSRQGHLPRRGRLLTLPEWLLVSCGEFYGAMNETMAAASGLYDLASHTWSDRLMDASGARSADLDLCPVTSQVDAPLGRMLLNGRKISVFGGVGDMQAAMLGAGIPVRAPVAINMGTGSQVARLIEPRETYLGERRPFFDGNLLSAITHIPAGRALELFSRIADEFSAQGGGRRGTFWEILRQLTPEEVLASPLEADLNVFAGAWRFAKGGLIAGLREGNTSARQLVASLARAWLAQYADALRLLDPQCRAARVAVAGGLARRAPACVPVLEALLGREVLPAGTEEETLRGLTRLAMGEVS